VKTRLGLGYGLLGGVGWLVFTIDMAGRATSVIRFMGDELHLSDVAFYAGVLVAISVVALAAIYRAGRFALGMLLGFGIPGFWFWLIFIVNIYEVH
jgi:uncharacterized membrane protein